MPFPHLKLSRKINGLHKPVQGGGYKEINATTLANLADRQGHGERLLTNVETISSAWANKLDTRAAADLPELPDSAVTPIFLQIDTDLFDVESLKSFKIEIISEEEDGYIIGASSDNFRSLKEKIQDFISKDGKFQNKASQLWKVNEGEQWRIDKILSDDLQARWDQIKDNDQFVVFPLFN